MTVAERCVEKIQHLAVDQRPRYAEALHDSMVWDSDDDLKPPSSKDLDKWHRLPLLALSAQLVILTKAEVAELLKDVGHPINLPTVKKMLSETSYRKTFRREPSWVGNKLVFTYTEALLLVEFDGPLDPPADLLELLPKG